MAINKYQQKKTSLVFYSLLNLLTKFQLLFSLLFLSIFIFSFLLYLLEFAGRPGLIERILKIPNTFLLYLAILVAPTVINKRSLIFLSKIHLFAFFIILTLTNLSYQVLNALEVAHYANYVYQKYYLAYPSLKLLNLLLEVLLVVTAVNFFLKKENAHTLKKLDLVPRSFSDSAGSIIISILLVSYFFYNFTSIFNINLLKRVTFMLAHPNASYEEKMTEQLSPNFYSYMKFIQQNTPPQSRILIPPQEAPWYMYGNAGYLRYFLYPRTLVSGKRTVPPGDLSTFQYLLLLKGKYDPNVFRSEEDWPQFQVPAKEVIYLLPSGEIKREAIDTFLYPPKVMFPSHFALLKL